MKKIILALLIVGLIACTSVKKSMEITLRGNPSTGYGWQVVISDESLLSLVNEEFVPEESELVGVGGDFVFEFTALKAGEVSLTFTYLRSWEEEEAIYTLVYEFLVEENLTIRLQEVSGNYSEEEIPKPLFK